MENENGDQQLNNQVPINDQVPGSRQERFKKQVLIVVALIFVIILIAGGVYFWQESKIKKLDDFNTEKINTLNNRMLELEAEKNTAEQEKDKAEQAKDIAEQKQDLIERKTCKGEWKNGVCVMKTCVDSDINKRPDDIYIKGNVVYTDVNGVSNTIYDECTGTKKQVNEMYCYESPKGSENYVQGRELFDCPNGCFDGACIR